MARRTGVELSPQTVQECFRDRPARFDVRTLTAILNTLACPLQEIIRFTPPASTEEARATTEEAVRYRRSQASAVPPAPRAARSRARAQAKPRVARPSTDRARLLAALAEGAEPLVAEHLRQHAAEATPAASAKKKGAGKR